MVLKASQVDNGLRIISSHPEDFIVYPNWQNEDSNNDSIADFGIDGGSVEFPSYGVINWDEPPIVGRY